MEQDCLFFLTLSLLFRSFLLCCIHLVAVNRNKTTITLLPGLSSERWFRAVLTNEDFPFTARTTVFDAQSGEPLLLQVPFQ
jgi:hypothetical protein